jgi:hypothetical protein
MNVLCSDKSASSADGRSDRYCARTRWVPLGVSRFGHAAPIPTRPVAHWLRRAANRSTLRFPRDAALTALLSRRALISRSSSRPSHSRWESSAVSLEAVGGVTSIPADSRQFTYVPVVTAVSPASGPETGGTDISITGAGFARDVEGVAETTVVFGGKPAP